MRVKQVDVSGKQEVVREAVAEGYLKLRPETVRRIVEGKVEKGEPFALAEVGGLIAAKETPKLLPLCHQLRLEKVEVDLTVDEERSCVRARSVVKARERTGVEMEALVAVTIALLNVWDAVKQYEKDESGQYPHTEIFGVRVLSKVKGEGA
ncbi:MAG: cyclic pyranopterin monophosphate synthase MoaC [Thaumarchaeota archaeon]|nr:cyclic pyranopterin monophosphate synthase MoaC [Candidatus Calditenuaceae archaeon]MCX8203274.1 cyclic pyranopterin monophosphate synthase MoaC [Nitrososphaeria archaeon]MDW8043045.1 cyclic pyranopterin monophosphate synthase MoaC [Nitrososphaerota archaeon]